MTNFKVCVQHDHEEKIAAYCAQNNIDFNLANAYEVVLETFKKNPLIYKTRDSETGKETEQNFTFKIARQIECQSKVEKYCTKEMKVYFNNRFDSNRMILSHDLFYLPYNNH